MTAQEHARQRAPVCAWEHFPHQADVGVRGFGPAPERAFEQVARAMTAVVSDLQCVRPRCGVAIHCRGSDLELLLYDWLNTLIFEMATRHMLFSRFEASIRNGELRATARGEALDVERHDPRVEIKGATFTELKVTRDARGVWRAQCILDV
jgi:SHS2 domain-containing protein